MTAHLRSVICISPDSPPPAGRPARAGKSTLRSPARRPALPGRGGGARAQEGALRHVTGTPSAPEVMDQLAWDAVTPQNLNFLKATGVDCLRVHVPGAFADGQDHTADFRRLRGVIEQHGLRLAALH